MNKRSMIGKWPLLAMVALSVFVFGVLEGLFAQPPQATTPPAQAATSAKPVPPVSRTYLTNRVPMREHMYYQGVWGVDSLKVKYTESGEIIRFSYTVVDPVKAAPLNEKTVEPSLIDPQAGVSLVIPEMENIGKMRQSSTAIAGKQYWMAFSNSGRRVRPGDRVNVQIGSFHAMNLPVE